MTAWWPALRIGAALVLLAVVFACPLMVTVAAMPAASSCHDRPGQDHHGDTSAAFTCCATVVAKASLRTAPETDAGMPSPVAYEPSPVRSIDPGTAPLRARPPTLPLFLQHASFLI